MAWSKPSLNDVLESLESNLKAQPLFTDVDTSQYAATGQLLRAVADVIDQLYTTQIGVETALDVDNAVGKALVALAALVGLQQKNKTRSTTTSKFDGTPGTSVPTGTQIKSSSGDIWETVEAGVVEPSGSVTVEARAVEYGPVTLSSINAELVTSIPGITSVVLNKADIVVGHWVESWDDLRDRIRSYGMSGRGSSSVDAIEARISGLDWVEAVLVKTNRGTTVVDTMQPKSLRVVVYPETANPYSIEDLVKAIWDDAGVPAGIYMNGAQTATVRSPWGNEETIRWDWAADEDTDVQIELDTATLGDNAPDTDTEREDAILGAVKDWYSTRVGIGQDLVASHLVAYLVDALSWVGNLTVKFREMTTGTWGDVYEIDGINRGTFSGTLDYSEV